MSNSFNVDCFGVESSPARTRSPASASGSPAVLLSSLFGEREWRTRRAILAAAEFVAGVVVSDCDIRLLLSGVSGLHSQFHSTGQ